MFIHDEIVCEIPNDDIKLRHAAAYRCAFVMIQAAVEVHPDIPAVVEPALMHFFDKNAETVLNNDGFLIPFEERAP